MNLKIATLIFACLSVSQAAVTCNTSTYKDTTGVYGAELSGLTTIGSSISGCLTAGNNGALRIIANDVDWYDASLFWQVTVVNNPPSLSGVWLKYDYTINSLDRPDLSHWILDLSDNCVTSSKTSSGCVKQSSWSSLEFNKFTSSGGANLPAQIKGVKFDSLGSGSPWSFTFYSQRVPVWGDFWGKGGSSAIFYNQGLTASNKGTSASYYIATPDTKNFVVVTAAVPEPASYAFALGCGMAVIFLYSRRRSEATKDPV